MRFTYEEREERIYDCKPLLVKGGVFVHLRKYENFARAFIEFGAVCWDIDPNVDSNVVWNNRIDLCPDTCYINSVPACAKGLTREEMLEAKNAMLAMGVDGEKKMLLQALPFHAESSGGIGGRNDIPDW